jgi:hypothetical protein
LKKIISKTQISFDRVEEVIDEVEKVANAVEEVRSCD